jgi:hypothetical protein
MPYLVTDHRTYKYFSDLRSAIDFVSKENNKDLRIYADSGKGELEEISPSDLLRETSFGSLASQSNNSYTQSKPSQRDNNWQAPQVPQRTTSNPRYNTIENPYEENNYSAQKRQAPEQASEFSHSERRRTGFNPLSSLLTTLIIFLIIVIAYFILIPIIIGNAIVGFGG